MENLTKYELKLIPGNSGIKDYQNMLREELLSTLDESMGLKEIAKIQNLSQNELKQITKMSNLLQNELEQIAKMRHIKDYKNMSKEKLLIALLKSEQSRAELYKGKSNNAEVEETRKIFNEIKNKLSKSKIKEIRRDLYKKEKKFESNKESVRRKHAKELKKAKKILKELREKILKKYYKPIRTRGAFNDNYLEYES